MIRTLVVVGLMWPVVALAGLQEEIALERRQSPGAFAAVDALYAQLPGLDARKRGGLLPVGLLLKPLGKDAVLPLIEEVAFVDRANNDPELSPSARLGWRVGVLEALGVLRDVRARPVLEGALARPEEAFAVTRAAAEALGRLGDDEAAAALIKHSRGHNAEAVLAGMGACRRTAVAHRLSEALGETASAEQAQSLARALGEVGNAWAWQTPAVRRFAPEEAQVRRIAAQALVTAFVRFEGEVRQAASNALLVVDAPEAPQLVARARQRASGETAAALAERAHNPRPYRQ